VPFCWLEDFVEGLVELLLLSSAFGGVSQKFADSWGVHWDSLVKMAAPAIVTTPFIVTRAILAVYSHGDVGGEYGSSSILDVFHPEDGSLHPLASVILGVNLVVSLEGPLPFPGLFGFALERCDFNGPSVDPTVHLHRLSRIL
jgi:hypothetical protein